MKRSVKATESKIHRVKISQRLGDSLCQVEIQMGLDAEQTESLIQWLMEQGVTPEYSYDIPVQEALFGAGILAHLGRE